MPASFLGAGPAAVRPSKSNLTPAATSSRRAWLAGGGLTAGVVYALVAERAGSVSITTRPHPDLPPELDGLRAVQLTDIHHGPWLSIDHVRAVVRTTNELNADLVLLTGDYVSESQVYVAPVVAELAALRPKIGTLAIMGNHDWWEGGRHGVVQREFEKAGIPLIDNDRRILTPDRRLVERAASGLCIAGVGDLWCHEQDYKRALGGLPRTMPRVLLSHNPDVAEEPDLVGCGCRVDVQLSGHTHGGQIWIPGMGTPVVPSRYGQKYAQGWVDGPVSRVFVCRGLGLSVLPLRCGVRPEIAVLEFRPRSDKPDSSEDASSLASGLSWYERSGQSATNTAMIEQVPDEAPKVPLVGEMDLTRVVGCVEYGFRLHSDAERLTAGSSRDSSDSTLRRTLRGCEEAFIGASPKRVTLSCAAGSG
jgi:predicted MPP superfamily phosphohydrolase